MASNHLASSETSERPDLEVPEEAALFEDSSQFPTMMRLYPSDATLEPAQHELFHEPDEPLQQLHPQEPMHESDATGVWNDVTLNNFSETAATLADTPEHDLHGDQTSIEFMH